MPTSSSRELELGVVEMTSFCGRRRSHHVRVGLGEGFCTTFVTLSGEEVVLNPAPTALRSPTHRRYSLTSLLPLLGGMQPSRHDPQPTCHGSCVSRSSSCWSGQRYHKGRMSGLVRRGGGDRRGRVVWWWSEEAEEGSLALRSRFGRVSWVCYDECFRLQRLRWLGRCRRSVWLCCTSLASRCCRGVYPTPRLVVESPDSNLFGNTSRSPLDRTSLLHRPVL